MPGFPASPSSPRPAPPSRNASQGDRRAEAPQSRGVVVAKPQTIVDAYVLEPGTAGNNVSTPHAALMNGVTDLTMIVCAALDDWTPASDQTLVSKYSTAATGSWSVAVTPTGILKVQTAIAAAVGITSSTVAPSVADGNAIWLNIQRTSTGSTDYFYSYDPPGTPLSAVTWTPLQLNRAGTAGAPDDSTVNVHVGGQNVGATNPLAGKVFRATAFKGLGTGGTQLFDMRPADWTSGATWVSSTTGETWTINGTASVVPAVGSASSDISVVATAAVGIASIGLDAHNVTAVATQTVGIGAMALDAHNVDVVAGEALAIGVLAVDAHNVVAVASESAGVGVLAVDAHNVIAVAAGSVAVGDTGVVTLGVAALAAETVAVGSTAAFVQSVTATGSAIAAVASTAAITHGVTAQATEGVAAGLSGLDAHNVTAVSTEGIAVAGTGTTLTGSDISVFARAGLAVGAQAAATRTLTATGVESGAVGAPATITRTSAYTARLDAATSIAASIALAVALVARMHAAAASTAAATYTTTAAGPVITGRLTTARGDVDRQTVRGDADRATSTPTVQRATTTTFTDRVLEPA